MLQVFEELAEEDHEQYNFERRQAGVQLHSFNRSETCLVGDVHLDAYLCNGPWPRDEKWMRISDLVPDTHTLDDLD